MTRQATSKHSMFSLGQKQHVHFRLQAHAGSARSLYSISRLALKLAKLKDHNRTRFQSPDHDVGSFKSDHTLWETNIYGRDIDMNPVQQNIPQHNPHKPRHFHSDSKLRHISTKRFIVQRRTPVTPNTTQTLPQSHMSHRPTIENITVPPVSYVCVCGVSLTPMWSQESRRGDRSHPSRLLGRELAGCPATQAVPADV